MYAVPVGMSTTLLATTSDLPSVPDEAFNLLPEVPSRELAVRDSTESSGEFAEIAAEEDLLGSTSGASVR